MAKKKSNKKQEKLEREITSLRYRNSAILSLFSINEITEHVISELDSKSNDLEYAIERELAYANNETDPYSLQKKDAKVLAVFLKGQKKILDVNKKKIQTALENVKTFWTSKY